jgi:predicted nucleotidyltransferase component of viral defense system
MNGKSWDKIYQLQDRLLDIIFSIDNSFYLTGGTALHRFYYNLRVSYDLDFFSSSTETFYDEIVNILQKLLDEKIEYKIISKVKDFSRILIEDDLQIDFVNDRVYRYGKSNIINRFRIDNIENILSNKVCAIIDRDEEKDFFDLFAIAKNHSFNWENIFNICNKKQIVEKEVFVERIKSFPLIWLEKIRLIQPFEIHKSDIEKLIEDSIYGKDNSVIMKK